MSETAGTWLGVGIALTIAAVGAAVMHRWFYSRFSRAICGKLERRPSRTVQIRAWLGTWDPSEVDHPWNASLTGMGIAMYSLDEQGDVKVVLRYDSKVIAEHSGPVPKSFEEPRQQRTRRILLAYVALILIGLGVGYLLGNGPADSRLNAAAIGAFVALVVAALVPRLILAIKSFKPVKNRRPDSEHDATFT